MQEMKKMMKEIMKIMKKRRQNLIIMMTKKQQIPPYTPRMRPMCPVPNGKRATGARSISSIDYTTPQ
jgi:hypothetical protein